MQGGGLALSFVAALQRAFACWRWRLWGAGAKALQGAALRFDAVVLQHYMLQDCSAVESCKTAVLCLHGAVRLLPAALVLLPPLTPPPVSSSPLFSACRKAKTSKLHPATEKCALSFSDADDSDVEVFLIRVPAGEDVAALKDVVIPEALLRGGAGHVDLPGGKRLIAANDVDPRQVRVVLPTGSVETVKLRPEDASDDSDDEDEEGVRKAKNSAVRNAVVLPKRIAGTLRLGSAPVAPPAAAAAAVPPTPLAPFAGLTIPIQSRVVVPQMTGRLKYKQVPLGSGSAGPAVVTVVAAPGTVYRSAAAPASPEAAGRKDKKDKKDKSEKKEKKEKKDKKDKKADDSD